MSGTIKRLMERAYEKYLRQDELNEAKLKPIIEPQDIMTFCEGILEFRPTNYQEKLMHDENQFIVARWCRQSGKSQALAAMVLYNALSRPKFRTVILAPSLRQSRKIIQRAESFLPKLPQGIVEGKVLRTKLEFINGSTIEALPNNPATVRGEVTNLLVVDELGFVQNDLELHDAAVYSLATTGGKFIGAGTPGAIDTLFFLMCTDDEIYGDVSRHHVSWRDAVEPNGPLKKDTLEKLRHQMVNDQWRWTREMDAEFSISSDTWIPLEMLSGCIDETLEYLPESRIMGAEDPVGDA